MTVFLFLMLAQPHSDDGLMAIFMLVSFGFFSVNLYTYLDIRYLEKFGEEDLFISQRQKGYREIKDVCVVDETYIDRLSNTEETNFSIVIPLNTIVRIRTPLADILPLNRRYLSFRYREYDLVFDCFKDRFFLFTLD